MVYLLVNTCIYFIYFLGLFTVQYSLIKRRTTLQRKLREIVPGKNHRPVVKYPTHTNT